MTSRARDPSINDLYSSTACDQLEQCRHRPRNRQRWHAIGLEIDLRAMGSFGNAQPREPQRFNRHYRHNPASGQNAPICHHPAPIDQDGEPGVP
jgi:hypothetical protein